MLINEAMCILINFSKNSLIKSNKFTFFFIMQFNFITTFIFQYLLKIFFLIKNQKL